MKPWMSRFRLAGMAVVIGSLFIVFAISFVMYGCQKPEQHVQSEGTLESVLTTKQLNVGYFIFEPTIMQDPNTGKLSGVFIDLIQSIARALDAKVIYHKVTLSNFAAALQSHQIDICIGATFATPQRATAVAFTRPLFYSGYTGVVKRGQAAKYTTWQSIDKPGVRVSVLQGSAVDDFVRENFKHATVIRLTGGDLTLPLAAVSSGQADVGLMNQQTVFTYLRAHPELQEILTNDPIAPTNFSWCVRPDDIRWLNFINTSLQYLENTGEMYRYESIYGIPLMHMKRELVVPREEQPSYWKQIEAGRKK